MIDLFCIFTTGGLILWSKSFVSGDFSIVLNDLIKTILMDEKKTQDYYIPVKGNGIILRWRIVNETGLIFVVAYQQSFNVLYTDKLLELIMKDFITNQLPSLNHSDNIFYTLPNNDEYNKTFIKLLNKWENYCKNEVENKKNINNINFQKSKTVIPGTETSTSNLKNNVLGNSQSSNPTPMPNIGGQNFVLRRKNPNVNNNNSNKKKDSKKSKNKKEGRVGMTQNKRLIQKQ